MCLTRPRSIFEALTRQPTPFLKIMSVLCVRAVLRWVCFLHIRSLSYLSTGSSAHEVPFAQEAHGGGAVPCWYAVATCNGARRRRPSKTRFQEATRNKTCFLLCCWWVILRFPQPLFFRLHRAFSRVEVPLDSINRSPLSRHFCL